MSGVIADFLDNGSEFSPLFGFCKPTVGAKNALARDLFTWKLAHRVGHSLFG